MGFIMHFYIIFRTNLLTGGPVQIAVFRLFQCFTEKEYQMESKRNETFARIVFLEQTQSRRLGVDVKEATRWPRGRRARLPPWARPPASWPPRFFLDVHSKSPGLRLFQKSLSRRFHSVWIPFDIPFLQNNEIGKKNSNLH